MPAKKLPVVKKAEIKDGDIKYVQEYAGISRLCIYVNGDWFRIYYNKQEELYFWINEKQVFFPQPICAKDLVKIIYANMKLQYDLLKDSESPMEEKWDKKKGKSNGSV